MYLVFIEKSNAFGLMKNREMGRIDLISAIHVAYHDKVIQSHGNQFFLMGTSVSTKNVVLVQIIAIGSLATGMVFSNQ